MKLNLVSTRQPKLVRKHWESCLNWQVGSRKATAALDLDIVELCGVYRIALITEFTEWDYSSPDYYNKSPLFYNDKEFNDLKSAQEHFSLLMSNARKGVYDAI